MTKRISGVLLLLASLAPAQSPQLKTNPKDHQQYVWIPAGKFLMGCSRNDNLCASDELPAHQVELTKGFWMGQTPVTVGAWKNYRAITKKPPLPDTDEFGRKLNEASDDNQPVVEANWNDAHDYCAWSGMRLPTEAEWEYAARAGSPLSNYDLLDQVAWFADNSGKKPVDSNELYRSDSARYQKRLFSNGNGPHDVKLKAPNAWGLYDMLGNVSEWVADFYALDYYRNSPAVDPTGPPSGTQRVMRGGAWNTVPGNTRISYRITNPPGDRVNTFGFRCAGDLP